MGAGGGLSGGCVGTGKTAGGCTVCPGSGKQQRKAEAPYSDIIVTQCMLCVGLCLGVLIWNYFAPEAALSWLAYCREQLHQLWVPELLEPFLRLDLPVYA